MAGYYVKIKMSAFLCLVSINNRSSHQRCSVKKKCSGLACNFVKKETLAQVFSCEFYEISKNTFFTEHL